VIVRLSYLHDLLQIIQVELEDGSTLVARKIMDKPYLQRLRLITNESDFQSLLHMLLSEARLLRWLGKAMMFPIPRILYPLDNSQEGDFMLQTMLSGETILNGRSKLSAPAKVLNTIMNAN
jgi:hypothetical protein